VAFLGPAFRVQKYFLLFPRKLKALFTDSSNPGSSYSKGRLNYNNFIHRSSYDVNCIPFVSTYVDHIIRSNSQQNSSALNGKMTLQRNTTDVKRFAETHLQCAAKKYPLKFFLPFSQQPLGIFTWNFTHLLLIHSHIKVLSSIVLFLIATKLLNFLRDYVVISDVHEMFAERKTHHIL